MNHDFKKRDRELEERISKDCLRLVNESDLHLDLMGLKLPHQIAPLSKAEMMGALPVTIFLCIAPKDYGGKMNMVMSPDMFAAFPAMERLLLKELNIWHITPDRQKAHTGA